MTLKQWIDNGWLRPHKTSVKEIENLFMIIDRDLKDANYLDACRTKRNVVEYDYIGAVTENDANELIEFVKDLKDEVETWFEQKHPRLA